MGWGGWFKREGTYVCLWLIHVDVGQKPTKFCKAIFLRLKNKLKKKKTGVHYRENTRSSWFLFFLKLNFFKIKNCLFRTPLPWLDIVVLGVVGKWRVGMRFKLGDWKKWVNYFRPNIPLVWILWGRGHMWRVCVNIREYPYEYSMSVKGSGSPKDCRINLIIFSG